MAEEQKEVLWNRWMREYWQARLEGPYPPLSSGEMAAMVVWSFKMTVVFAEIVSLILRSPVPVGSGTYLYSTMERPRLRSIALRQKRPRYWLT